MTVSTKDAALKRAARHTALIAAVFTLSIRVIGQGMPPPATGSVSTIEPKPAQRQALFVETFDVVWQTIRDSYYDRTFRGIDWDEARTELRPRATSAASTEELRDVLRELLARLGESHFKIWPQSADEQRAALTPIPQMRGTVGVDHRWISDALLITRLERDGAAWAAGVRPGWTIESIEGIQVVKYLLHAAKPELTPARRLKAAWLAVSNVLDGAVGDAVHVRFHDAEGSLRSLALDRRAPVASGVSIAGLPSLPMEFEARAVPVASGGAIAVIRFSVFAPEVLARLAEALDLLRAAGPLDGVVLDLRGNRGGYGPMIAGLGGLFLDRPCVLARLRSRDSELAYQTVPQPSTFHGPLGLLVDGLTASTGEVFAGGLQSIGRARIFGDRTLGAALPSYTRTLPTGDLLQYVVADLRLPDGRRIEGSGVMPDEVVYPSRPTLLQGRDPALEAASNWIVASRKSADTNTSLRCQAGG